MASERLIKFAKLNPGEEKDFRLLFIQSLLSGFGASFFFVVVNTYFIKKTSVPSLPPAYIMSGIFGYLLIILYKGWQKKLGAVNSYTIGFFIYGLSAIALYAARFIFGDNSDVSIYIAYIGFIVVLPYSSMQALGFSTICLRVFNISQSKRLLALIGTGEVIASIIAYLLIPFLTKLLGGTAPLLLISGIANIAAILPLRGTYNHNREKLDSITFSDLKKKMNLDFFREDTFYLLIAVVTVFSVMAVYFADYTYLLSVRYIAKENGMEVATVVAVVFSIIKTGELLVSIFSGKIIRSYGMRISLIMLPALLVLSTLIGFSTGLLFLEIPFFLVFFLLVNKWNERVIRKGVTIPAMKVVYQVTDASHRAQLQTSIDGTISQYATILAGVLLWVLSLAFSNNDLLYFLKIVAIVYLVSFALWTLFTFRLYERYKVKIMEYLHRFKHDASDPDIQEIEADTEDQAEEDTTEQHPLVKQAIDRPMVLNLENISTYICYYNPDIKRFLGESSILRKITAAYYNNENFFSRLLIIWYMEFQNEEARINFVKEYYSVSQLQLRVQMISMLNKTNYKRKPEDTFFFTALCEDIASEIMWAESSINDISGQVDQELVDALKQHINTLQNLLFEVLKVLYDKESIQVVQEMMLENKDNSLEKQLFAIELLDNVLETQMKLMVMPLLEDTSYNLKKERLHKILLVYHLPCAARLKEILMANFMTIGPHIKQIALQEYYKLTGDKAALNAFAASYVENLNATAASLLYDADERVYMAKIKVMESMNIAQQLNPDMLAYFTKWGLFSKEKKRGGTNLNEYLGKQTYQFNEDHIATVNYERTELSIDPLGLSLMLQMSKQ